ncbi:MAG TPA: zf-HC2 domain-containing protein [Burkholderiaceae bacterium]|nr:zf-HC2 domain-containing protein [Burkholderiaceae bacterium]
MNCPLDDEISAYADDMLSPVARQQLTTHLSACPRCRQRLEEFGALRHALQQLPSPQLGFDLAARLQPQWGARPVHRPPPRRPWLNWVGWGGPGLAAALSIASGVWLGSLMLGAGGVAAPSAAIVRVFDPVPPGGLCAAVELCRGSQGMQ